jgi:hypothetical protein
MVANLFVVDVKVSARDCVCPFSHHTAEACDFARVRARARVISARDGRSGMSIALTSKVSEALALQ